MPNTEIDKLKLTREIRERVRAAIRKTPMTKVEIGLAIGKRNFVYDLRRTVALDVVDLIALAAVTETDPLQLIFGMSSESCNVCRKVEALPKEDRTRAASLIEPTIGLALSIARLQPQ